MRSGTYAPPTPEQNIRSFERFPISRENIVVNYKFYGRLGYGEESEISLENSINDFKIIARLNKENPFVGTIYLPTERPLSPPKPPFDPQGGKGQKLNGESM